MMKSRSNYGSVSYLYFVLILLFRSSVDEALLTELAFVEHRSTITIDQENASRTIISQPFSFAKERIMQKSCLMR